MDKEELKNKCKERAKIFQQAMESCHSSSPIDCIEWFADKIAELEEKISVLLSCKNCPENKGGLICAKEYENECLAQKIEYIKELQQENEVLKGRTEGFEKQILGLLYKYESVYKRFPDLKSAMDKAESILKENAELRKELKEWKDEWQEQVQKATDEGYARTLQTMQLTKAKDKLKRIKNIFYNGETNDRRLVQIGDILSEVEK
jgi:hypothetical protein